MGARSHWKCPIAYFLADKMSSKTQAKLVRTALRMAAEAGLRVWSVTTDGTSVNISMFRELGCNFTTSLQTMITKFKHPTQDYFVYAVQDPCHMLKLAINALGHLGSFLDSKFLDSQIDNLKIPKGQSILSEQLIASLICSTLVTQWQKDLNNPYALNLKKPGKKFLQPPPTTYLV